MFIDLLTHCSIFSNVMQVDEIGIAAALTIVLKTLCEMEKLVSKPMGNLLCKSLSKRVWTW